MDSKNLKLVEDRIDQEIAKTEESIIEYKEVTQPIAPENAIGRVSRMDAINNKSVVEAALRKAQEKLRSLKELKDKIGDKDFGRCRKCHQVIPLPRILFMPQSPYCVNCAP